jgi:hypothetical protein
MKPLAIRSGGGPDFPHLPPGREPGAQTLHNRHRVNLAAPFVGIVGTAMYAAGIWVAAGGRGHGFDRQEELYGGLFFAACGLLCVFGGYVMWGRVRPKRHPRLRGTSLTVQGDALRRGGEISVTFTGPRTNGERLEVGIACDERYDIEVRAYTKFGGTVVRQTNQTTVHEQWQPVAGGVAEQTLTFQVPDGVPYSYEGECVSYAWRASGRAVRPHRRDARHDEPIWVEA